MNNLVITAADASKLTALANQKAHGLFTPPHPFFPIIRGIQVTMTFDTPAAAKASRILKGYPGRYSKPVKALAGQFMAAAPR